MDRNNHRNNSIQGALEGMKCTVLIEKDEDGSFAATVPSLPGCHTQAKSRDELPPRITEAIEVYRDVKGCIDREEFIEVQVIDRETCRSEENT